MKKRSYTYKQEMGYLIFVSLLKRQEEFESKALMAWLVLFRRRTRSATGSEGRKPRIGAEAGKPTQGRQACVICKEGFSIS